MLASLNGNKYTKYEMSSFKRYLFQGMTYTGDRLLREGPWTRYDCERTCRLYADCQAFAMEWLNGTKQEGYCILADHKVNPEEAIVNNISSIFGK